MKVVYIKIVVNVDMKIINFLCSVFYNVFGII